jgi:aldehyde:ferredoxin oxidoreductase
MNGGYVGKMLFVDLTNKSIEEKELSEDMADNFMGGLGIGARILYDMIKPGADPLGPDNVLGFVTGPLTATGALFSGRYVVVCKSPVTGAWNDAKWGDISGLNSKKQVLMQYLYQGPQRNRFIYGLMMVRWKLETQAGCGGKTLLKH